MLSLTDKNAKYFVTSAIRRKLDRELQDIVSKAGPDTDLNTSDILLARTTELAAALVTARVVSYSTHNASY